MMYKNAKQLFCIPISFLFLVQLSHSQNSIKHFIFFSQDREGIHDSTFYLNPGIAGAQITYPWKKLENKKDDYDFGEIKEDIEFLQSKGKKLFIQLQDVTFDSTLFVTPKYILNDTDYHGGANSQYEFINDDENKPIKAGWVTRRWDKAVANRFHKLLYELGKQFDGKIEGINLPETSVEFGSKGNLHPPGFTYVVYRDAIKENMRIAKLAFPKSVTIQYANFMPGETLPKADHFYLKSIYKYAEEIKSGVGGPDIKVYKWFQMKNSYGLIRNAHGKTITGVAVQEGNYSVINPKTGKQVTVPEILDFAINYLRLDYIFWCTEEPFYSKEVLPMLQKIRHKK